MNKIFTEENCNRAIRIGTLLLSDIILINLASFLALWVRLDFSVEQIIYYDYFATWKAFALVSTVLIIVLLALMKLYTSLWAFASVEELVRIVCVGAGVALLEMVAIFVEVLRFPRSFPLLHGMFLITLITASRFSYRGARLAFRYVARLVFQRTSRRPMTKKRTMLIGAGEAGTMALREFQNSEHSENRVVCIIDDDLAKRGHHLRGVKIVGGRDQIIRAAQKYQVEEIVVAIPGAKPRQRRAIVDLCQQTGCKLKTLPGLFQLANDEVSIQKIRDVDVLDLLGRDSIQVDLSQISGYLEGKTVLFLAI